MARTLGLALALTVGVSCATAQAQAPYRVEGPASPPDEPALAEAEAAFVQGATFVAEGQWADALAQYEEAYRLSGVPAALFNVGTTLRSMGRHRDARDVFAQLLEDAELEEEMRANAQARLYEEAGRLARIQLRGLEAATDATVLLDGRATEIAEWDPVELEVDPGEHGVVVEREGFHPFHEELRLEDAGRARIDVTLRAIERPAPIVVTTTETDDSVWGVVAAIVAVVVAGAAVGIGLGVYYGAQLTPQSGFDGLVVELP